ncbi:MAG: ABC transporter permease subunit [Gammaproteobacteria bacterium]|nr:ABC transporter permease subunit [Gammaproteobacteria bacterium]
MNAGLAITRRELLSLFVSPLAWTILAVVQFIVAWTFLVQIDVFIGLESRLARLEAPPGVTDLVVTPTLSNAALVFLLVTPLLTMRLLAGERRGNTMQLLRAAPISTLQVVLGKFFGVYIFLLALLAMLVLMPLALLAGTDLDLGKLASGVMGLALLLAMLTSAGLYLSSLTRQPAVAAAMSCGLFLLLWLLNSGGHGDAVTGFISLAGHLQGMLRGLFTTADVGYFIIATLLFLALTVQRLDAERLQR